MPNKDTVNKLKKMYALYEDAKPEAIEMLFEMLAPDVKWHSLANGQHGLNFTGERTGPAEVQEYFAGLQEALEMVYYTVSNYICDDDHVVALIDCSWKSRKSGEVFVSPKADVFRFQGQQITEFREYYDTAALSLVCR